MDDTYRRQQNFIQQAIKVHNGKYDYSRIVYTNCYHKVEILCPEHGSFFQSPTNHLSRKSGCTKCRDLYKRQLHGHSIPEFVKKARNIHGTFYDYSYVNYTNNKTKVEIICPIHGSFWKTPSNHITAHQGCPSCTNKSKAETHIGRILNQQQVTFIRECTFGGCVNEKGNKLKFDFYLPDYNTVIEYDGEHHFMPRRFGGIKEDAALKLYEKFKRSDQLKNDFCYKHDINMIRIPYWEKGNIKQTITNYMLCLF